MVSAAMVSSAHVVAHCPADDLAGEEIEDHAVPYPTRRLVASCTMICLKARVAGAIVVVPPAAYGKPLKFVLNTAV
jgi:hypothetical protein